MPDAELFTNHGKEFVFYHSSMGSHWRQVGAVTRFTLSKDHDGENKWTAREGMH